jgi:hypothetical protein
MSEIPVIKHWIVTGFTPAATLDDSIAGGELPTLYETEQLAMAAAKTAAANSPGAYFVVYEAKWWSHTDITPVHLKEVTSGAVN